MQTQQNIKDADGVDKLANAAVSQGKLRPAEGSNTFGTKISKEEARFEKTFLTISLSTGTTIMHCKNISVTINRNSYLI